MPADEQNGLSVGDVRRASALSTLIESSEFGIGSLALVRTGEPESAEIAEKR